MKLLRWAVAGAASASVYVVYKYSIGNKAKGEDVFGAGSDAIGKADNAPAKPAKQTAAPKDTAKS